MKDKDTDWKFNLPSLPRYKRGGENRHHCILKFIDSSSEKNVDFNLKTGNSIIYLILVSSI